LKTLKKTVLIFWKSENTQWSHSANYALLLFGSIVLLLGSLYQSLFTKLYQTTWTLTWSYFIAAQLVFIVLITHHAKWKFKAKLSDIMPPLILLFLLLGLYWETRSQFFLEMHLWLDEFSQFGWATQPPDGNLMLGAAFDSQPPLAYPIYGAFTNVFGTKILFLKAPSFLFGALSLVAFYLLALKCIKSPILSFFAAVAFCIFPEFVFQSQEARVLNQFYFYLLFFILFLFEALSASDFRSKLLLAGVTFWMMLSIGLQPFIVLAWTFLVIALAKAFKLISKTQFINVLLGIFAGSLIAFPVLIQSLITSSRINKFNDNANQLIFAVKNFFDLSDLVPAFVTLWRSIGYFSASAILVLLATILILKTFDKTKRKLSFLILAVSIYPFLFLFIFRSVVQYKVYTRYFDAFFVILFCALAYLLSLWFNSFEKSKIKKKIFLGAILIGIFYSPLTSIAKSRDMFDQEYSWRVEWPQIYEFFLKSATRDNDCLFYLPLTEGRLNWAPSIYLGKYSSLKGKDPKSDIILPVYIKDSFRIGASAYASGNKSSCDKIYWVLSGGDFARTKRIAYPQEASLHVFSSIRTEIVVSKYSVKNRDFYQRFKNAFRPLLEMQDPIDYYDPLLAELGFAAVVSGDLKLAVKILGILRPRYPKSSATKGYNMLVALEVLEQSVLLGKLPGPNPFTKHGN
jgi:hypothetical protein